MKDYQEYGFQYIELVSYAYATRSTGAPSPEDAAAFEEDYGFTTAMALVDDSGFHSLFEIDGASPSISYLGPDMSVLAVDTTTTSPGAYIDTDGDDDAGWLQ
ncbi:MAG: hypothetical protein D6798_04960 [Deltaproteobacteria bacterium]|nr:MAG: hypothetical protein D6798_04960 [Deltaproteobacteria bacterium]